MSAAWFDPLETLAPEDFGIEIPDDIDDVIAQAQDQEEEDRQARIAIGIEAVCFGCGCSDSRRCPGGCVWATPTLCSRCV